MPPSCVVAKSMSPAVLGILVNAVLVSGMLGFYSLVVPEFGLSGFLSSGGLDLAWVEWPLGL